MQPRLSVLTLGVDDLERAVEFYRDGLGWPTEGIVGQEFADGAVAFFDLQPGLKLALFPRRSLAKDAGLGAGTLTTTAQSLGPTDFSLGHNVRTRDEVDTLLAEAKEAGATIIKPAGDTFWGGYAGYFRDPDQHLWEVVWNPHLLPE